MRRRFVLPTIASSEITPEAVCLKRRDFMRAAGLAATVPALSGLSRPAAAAVATGGRPLVYLQTLSRADGFDTDEQPTPLADITSQGNFYEFGTDKADPGRYAHEMTVDPSSLEVDGAVH